MEEKAFYKLSGKFRKKQLQEKRAQKRDRRAGDDDHDESAWAPVEGGGDDDEEDEDAHARSGGNRGKGKHLNSRAQAGGNKRDITAHKGQQHQHQHQRRCQQHQHHQQKVVNVGRGESEADVSNRLQPIEYVPLVDVQHQAYDGQECHLLSQASIVETAHNPRMPVCDPGEVGEVEELRSVLGMPKRPKWQGVVSSSQQLHELEEREFDQWKKQLACEWTDVSFYEPRLEFWRQLWRALESSDIVLQVVDARNPLLHFSAALAHHVLVEHQKTMVLCLNKCDLIPPAAVSAWVWYFQQHFSGLRVVASSATAGDASARAIVEALLQSNVRKNGVVVQAQVLVGASAADVLRQSKVRNTVSKRGKAVLTARQTLLQEQEMQQQRRQRLRMPQQLSSEEEEAVLDKESSSSSSSSSGSGAEVESGSENVDEPENPFARLQEQQHATAGSHPAPASTVVVVAVVGEPNVGKSSTMNMLLGAHRVATSSHPGRTKKNQTHFMMPHLKLLDAPGLVFPRRGVSMPMQVLFGSLPIASCRDPYSVLAYLAARMWPRLHIVLGLRKVSEDGKSKSSDKDDMQESSEEQWAPLELAEAFSAKKNWRAHHGGRLDTFRGANWLLRAALAGHSGVVLAFLPPGYSSPKASGQLH